MHRFQAHNNKERHRLLQFFCYGPSANVILNCTSSKPNATSQTWLQCFKPKLDCSLLGTDYQLLWPVSINYPDFTTVCSVPLFRVCRVITGKTCLKLLFSRWQAGKTQEHVLKLEPIQRALSLQMAWSCYRPGWAEMGHGQSTFGWRRKASDPQDPESKRSVFEGKALHPDPCRPDTGFDCRWAGFQQPEGGNVGFTELNPDWMWSRSKVQSVQLWERERVKGQQTGFGGLWSCTRWE